MLPRVARLDTKTFAEAFAGGKTARHPLMSVRVWRSQIDCSDQQNAKKGSENAKIIAKTARAAFVVPKKQAKAAKRNRLRRRMRECYRQHPLLEQRKSDLIGCDLIFVATPAAHNATWDELNEAFAQLLRRTVRLSVELRCKNSQNSSEK